MIERGKKKKEEKLESAVVMEIRINWKFKKNPNITGWIRVII